MISVTVGNTFYKPFSINKPNNTRFGVVVPSKGVLISAYLLCQQSQLVSRFGTKQNRISVPVRPLNTLSVSFCVKNKSSFMKHFDTKGEKISHRLGGEGV